MKIGFLVTNPYQLHHYERIAAHLEPSTAIIEIRDRDFGVDEHLVAQHLPGWDFDYIPSNHIKALDGKFDALICQTPVAPMQFFERSLLVAQQYSLSKESYQYGVWRTQVDLNLMYGPYSVSRVQGFCDARSAGNPLLDQLMNGGNFPTLPNDVEPNRRTVLYLPTYGDLSALASTSKALSELDVDVVIKLHHMDSPARLGTLPDNFRLETSDRHPIELIRGAQAVISDYSGAAYDAALCRVPVLLTGHASPVDKDYVRLSSQDMERTHLKDLAEVWSADRDFESAYEAARQKMQNSDNYQLFVEKFVANPGAAGEACAQAVQDLVTLGASSHLVGEPVKTAIRKYVMANRELRDENAKLSQMNAQLTARSTGDAKRPTLMRIRRRLGRIRWMGKLYHSSRSIVSHLASDRSAAHQTSVDHEQIEPLNISTARPETLPTPVMLRSAMARAVREALQNRGVPVGTSTETDPGTLALDARHRWHLPKALSDLAAARPDLKVVVIGSTLSRKTVSADKLKPDHMLEATRIEVRDPYRFHDYLVDKQGSAVLQIVEYDPEVNRYLTLDRRASKPDWTEVFGSRRMQTIIEPASPNATCADRASDSAENSSPIDLVYTWVDSSDRRWQEERHTWSGEAGNMLASANNEERYANRDELLYSLRSVELFAPFVRNIYIVTAGQVPSWLNSNNDQIILVDHRDIFPDPSVLPVFNSHAIEACIHRIDGLAENYLYMNDDFIFGNEVFPDDFYTESGLVKCHVSPSQFVYDGKPEANAIPTDWASYNVCTLIQRDSGLNIRARLKHIPYPQLRSVCYELEQRYSEQIDETRAARFRSNSDLAIPSMLAPYYSVATHRGVIWPNTPHTYVYADTGRANWHTRTKKILKHRPKFICMNATRHAEIPMETQQRNLQTFLSSILPFPSQFEIGAALESKPYARGSVVG